MTYACYLLVTWALVHLFFAVNTDGTHVFLEQVGIPNKGIAKLHGDCPACLMPSCLDDRDCAIRLVHDMQDLGHDCLLGCITITTFSSWCFIASYMFQHALFGTTTCFERWVVMVLDNTVSLIQSIAGIRIKAKLDQ